MIQRKVLIAKGCTSEKLREIFTATEGCNKDIRTRIENRVYSRIYEGLSVCCKNAPKWQAVDVAWDSTPIQPETLPLLLWAQGKIKAGQLAESLMQTQLGAQCVTKVPTATGEELKIDIPRLYEVSINLIRSYVTRRLAAQTVRFSNLWPYFRYEPRGVDLVAKLRGDALSERMDIMADAYNYRHFFPQSFRHHFMYSRSVIFIRSAWDKVSSWRAKNLNLPSDKLEIESYTVREGVDFVAPHISRTFRDLSSPWANINTDTGPVYCGYWDIVRYGTIDKTNYYNTDCITLDEGLPDLVGKNGCFFQYYFDPCVLKWPDLGHNPAAKNDRRNQIGTYTDSCKDAGVLLTQYFEKINPFHEGISDLNVDVWVRYSVAGDRTIVAAEFLTSRPACYGGLNENDDREINSSMAMELMGFQDQLTNIFSQMLMNIRAGMLQIWAVDKDAFEPEMQEFIKKTLAAKNYYAEPQLFLYSGEALRSLGVQNPADNPRIVSIIQAQVQTTIQESLKAAQVVMDMADRILMMAPNEQGQPNPREVAAREITEISTTTDTIKTFVSDGIDEQRAAIKKLCYESLVCEDAEKTRVPVLGRYTVETVREAGFEVEGEFLPNQILPSKTPVIVDPSKLNYDYYFNSRDGADRALNSQGAQTMAQLLGQMMQIPPVAQAMGKKRLFEWANEIARMSGAPIDLNLELDEGEQEQIAPPQGAPGPQGQQAPPQGGPPQVQGVPGSPGEKPQPGTAPALEMRVQQLEAMLQQLADQLGGANQREPAPPQGAPLPPALAAA